MVFSTEDRVVIKVFRETKGYGAKKIMKEFPMKNWSLTSVNRLLRKIDSTGTAERKERVRSARTKESIENVEQLAMSQEDQPNTHRTVRQIARETGIKKSTVHNIVRKELHFKCLKKKRAQELTETNKLARLVRSKQLLRQYPQHLVHFIWFTDEKVFTVASPINPQNDRLYVPAGTKKKTVSVDRLLHTRPTFSKSLMVSVGVSSLGCTELIFVEPGVKINGAHYRDVLLAQHLLPAIRGQSGDYFIFQQDGAPAHRARDTVTFLRRETPEFISPSLWPANSPDLNPVDYKVWGVLQDRVYRTRIRDVEHLRERLVEEWSRFDQRIIDGAVKQWRHRLKACVRASGGHFEYQL